MTKLKIALLAGGDSPEREVSLGSARQVAAALDAAKYDVRVVDVHGPEWMNEGAWMDYALILIHGTPGEDGRIQGYLDMLGVPYSSCGMVSSVVTFDKQVCKRVVAAEGVCVAREVFLRRGDRFCDEKIVEELGLPLFVKPNASGSSFGVAKVKRMDELRAAIDAAFEQGDEVLVEEFLEGREIACGLMITGGKELVLPLTEIVSRNEFFDYEAKYTEGLSDEITPADLPEDVADRVREMAARAYRACRCRGLVRIDFMVSAAGMPTMIEVNSIPGMSAGSIVPKQAAAAGMSLGELFDIIISETRC